MIFAKISVWRYRQYKVLYLIHEKKRKKYEKYYFVET